MSAVTLRQVHDGHTAARDQVAQGVFSHGVAGQPVQYGDSGPQAGPEPGS